MNSHLIRRKIGRIHLLMLLTINIMLTGCAGIVPYKRLYQGAPKPLNQVAILTHRNLYLRDVFISKVDGRSATLGGLFELTPGPHTICAGFMSGKQRSRGCSNVEFTAEAGHVYEIYHVPYTHREAWYPAIWDITNELDYPEKKESAKKIDAVLKKNRGSGFVFKKAYTPPIKGKLVGFGEDVKSIINGKFKKKVIVEYPFNRYKPFFVAEGDDGNVYHLEISKTTGKVINVFGTRQTVGNWKTANVAFQPIDSELAYVKFDSSDWGNRSGMYRQVHKEISPGSFKLIKDTHYARLNDYHVASLLDVESYEGLPEELIRALVLAKNANTDILIRDPLINVQLKKKYALNSMEYRFAVQELAIKLGQEAVRKSHEFAGTLLQNSPYYNNVSAIIKIAKRHLAKSEREDKAMKFVPPIQTNSVFLRFYESPQNLTPHGKRAFIQRFPKSKTRLVAWELSLTLPKQKEDLHYDIYSVFKRPDGTVLTRQLLPSRCKAGWTNVLHTNGWGWTSPGNWPIGTYTIEIHIGGKNIINGQFEIFNDKK